MAKYNIPVPQGQTEGHLGAQTAHN